MDYLTVVQQLYQIDSEEVLSETISISSKKLKWAGFEERRYDAHQTVFVRSLLGGYLRIHTAAVLYIQTAADSQGTEQLQVAGQ